MTLSRKADVFPVIAQGATLTSLIENKQVLLNIAIPTIEDIHEYSEKMPCVFLLIDELGYTLYLFGHKKISEYLSSVGIMQGTCWFNSVFGDTAISRSLQQAKVSETFQKEHTSSIFYQFSLHAAPIFNHHGQLQGTLAVIIRAQNYSPCATALMYSAAHDIAGQLQSEQLLLDSNETLSEFYSLIDGVDEGVVFWTPDGTLKYLNQKSQDMLGLSSLDLGQNIAQFFHIPPQLSRAIKKRQELKSVQITLECKKKLVSLLFSLKMIIGRSKAVSGFIAIIKPLTDNNIKNKHGNIPIFSFDDFIDHSHIIHETIYKARQAEKGQGAIFIKGETGTGKYHFAQAIHYASHKDKPFITINCKSIPSHMMLEDFLGSHKKEHLDTLSKFEMAQGGTLYLEHVEYLIPEVQASLLQMLKTGFFYKINGNIHPLNVRIITNSSANLEEAVREKRFSHHLLLELTTFTLTIPSLRQRLDDLPYFINRQLSYLSIKLKKNLTISDAVIQVLSAYSWPGNIRELEHLLQQTASFIHGDRIEIYHLPEYIRDLQKTKIAVVSNNLVILEKKAIIRSALMNQGKINEMCLDLQIGRTTLWRKLKKHNINLVNYKK